MATDAFTMIHFSVVDGSGNVQMGTCNVSVPKTLNGDPAVDSGAVYTVNAP